VATIEEARMRRRIAARDPVAVRRQDLRYAAKLSATTPIANAAVEVMQTTPSNASR
jgi:hypothetical protein